MRSSCTFLLMTITQISTVRGFWIPNSEQLKIRTDLSPDQCVFGFHAEEGVTCDSVFERCNYG